jgi:acyl-CoA thioesterase I
LRTSSENSGKKRKQVEACHLSKKLNLTNNSIILFQGDSITDAERKANHNEALGDGYVMMIAAWLSALYPEFHLRFLNRGVGGNRVRDLRNRWKKDCLDLRPNVVSILVGVNDISWGGTSTESFQTDYITILEQTSKMKSQIVLLEPFLVHYSSDLPELTKELDKKLEVLKKLAIEFEAKLIPLNDIFMKACLKREPSFWALDGVHPTLAGHALIAQAWLKGVIDQP